MQKVSAVIPAYNEQNRIRDTLDAVKQYVDEIIVIDDASTDNTADMANVNGVRVVSQHRNMGYIKAIKRGFVEAKGDIVVILDADGEFSADKIPALIRPIKDGRADMVQGHRDYIPRYSERVLTWLAEKKASVGDSGTGLRALRRELALRLELKGSCICGVFALEVISKGGEIAEIPIKLEKIEKPRKIAWFHIQQFFYLLPWLLK